MYTNSNFVLHSQIEPWNSYKLALQSPLSSATYRILPPTDIGRAEFPAIGAHNVLLGIGRGIHVCSARGEGLPAGTHSG